MFARTLLIFVIVKARVLTYLSKYFKKGSGTALPGYIVEKYIPWILRHLLADYKHIILISGTNGKTTARAILTHILTQNHHKVASNVGGANIIRGIASSLIGQANWYGKPRSPILVLEVEEASLPILTQYCKPNILILTNIFRDQLDAYGELDHTLGFFTKSILQSSPDTIIVNTDDAKLLSSIPSVPKDTKIIGFGIDMPSDQLPAFEQHENSQKSIKITEYIQATSVQIASAGSNWIMSGEKYQLPLPGIYNIYNALPAIVASKELFSDIHVAKALHTIQPVFGRGEEIHIGNTTLSLMLIKNPAGFDQVLSYLAATHTQNPLNISICINDNTADGKDVSWLWDTNIEGFVAKQKLNHIFTSGTRGLDMLLRLQYAGLACSTKQFKQTPQKLIHAITMQEGHHSILCTYTALLELRAYLQKLTPLKNINEIGN
jgi:lipid II isoglutaminyl synthase (glutamine-hydrolysing)